MGDNCCAATKDKMSGVDSHRKLSLQCHWFTPYFFLRSQEPRYHTGGGIIIAGCGLSIIFRVITRWWCIRKNKLLDRAEAETGEVTDWRYVTWCIMSFFVGRFIYLRTGASFSSFVLWIIVLIYTDINANSKLNNTIQNIYSSKLTAHPR